MCSNFKLKHINLNKHSISTISHKKSDVKDNLKNRKTNRRSTKSDSRKLLASQSTKNNKLNQKCHTCDKNHCDHLDKSKHRTKETDLEINEETPSQDAIIKYVLKGGKSDEINCLQESLVNKEAPLIYGEEIKQGRDFNTKSIDKNHEIASPSAEIKTELDDYDYDMEQVLSNYLIPPSPSGIIEANEEAIVVEIDPTICLKDNDNNISTGLEKKPFYNCDVCKAKFVDYDLWQSHREMHTFICPFCNDELSDSLTLTRHVKEEHSAKNNLFACPGCSRVYKNVYYLYKHTQATGCVLRFSNDYVVNF